MLELRHLNAHYGQAQALFDISLQVPLGSMVLVQGLNGAGKSTLLKSAMGLMPQVSGQVLWQGEDISGLAPHRRSAKGLGYVPEDRRIFTDLTVLENLQVGAQAKRRFADRLASDNAAPQWSVEKIFALFPNLAPMQHRLASHMSGGEQQMLTVARTLMGNPLMVLLDEPSEGVAPVIVEQMGEMILALKGQGMGVLLSEQNTHFAQWVSDRSYRLDRGVLAA